MTALTEEQGKQLCKLARSAILSTFRETSLKLDMRRLNFLEEKRGVFVTLKKAGKLRGCIGYPEPHLPLGVGLLRAARSAAFDDQRFPPLKESELKSVKIEVTVLTQPELVKASKPEEYLGKIKVGRDGLIIRNQYASGLLLPQVPVEWKWDVKAFLENTCGKAGLSPNAWKDKDTELFKFQGQVFEE